MYAQSKRRKPHRLPPFFYPDREGFSGDFSFGEVFAQLIRETEAFQRFVCHKVITHNPRNHSSAAAPIQMPIIPHFKSTVNT